MDQKFKPGSQGIQGNHQHRHRDRKHSNCVDLINVCQDDGDDLYECFEQVSFDSIQHNKQGTQHEAFVDSAYARNIRFGGKKLLT